MESYRVPESGEIDDDNGISNTHLFGYERKYENENESEFGDEEGRSEAKRNDHSRTPSSGFSKSSSSSGPGASQFSSSSSSSSSMYFSASSEVINPNRTRPSTLTQHEKTGRQGRRQQAAQPLAIGPNAYMKLVRIFEMCTTVLGSDVTDEHRTAERQKATAYRRSRDGMVQLVIPHLFQTKFPQGEEACFVTTPWRQLVDDLDDVVNKRSSAKFVLTAQEDINDAHYALEVLAEAYRSYTLLFRRYCVNYIRQLNQRHRDLEVDLFQTVSIGKALVFDPWVKASVQIRGTDLELVQRAWNDFLHRTRNKTAPISTGLAPTSDAVSRRRQLGGNDRPSSAAAAPLRGRELMNDTELEARKETLQVIAVNFKESVRSAFLPWAQRVAAVQRQDAILCQLWEQHIRVVMEQMTALGKKVHTETEQLRKMVENGIITANEAQIKDLRKKSMVEYTKFFLQLESSADVTGDVKAYLQKWYDIFVKEDIPRRERKLRDMQKEYVPVRAQAMKKRCLEDWVTRIEEKFKECGDKLSQVIDFYEALPVPAKVDDEDRAAMQAVDAALKAWLQTLLDALSAVKNKMGDAMEIEENETSSMTLQAEVDSKSNRILATATSLEQMEYISFKYAELITYVNRSNRDPADALAQFVKETVEEHKQTVEEHKRYETVPISFRRAEKEWQSLELDAIKALQEDVNDLVIPLMKPFEGARVDPTTGKPVDSGGALYAQGVLLVQAIKKEHLVWSKYNPGTRFDFFSESEWTVHQSAPPIAKRSFKLSNAVVSRAELTSWTAGIQSALSTTASAGSANLFVKCKVDMKDFQDLLFQLNSDAGPFLEADKEMSLKEVWKLLHLLYFTALLTDEWNASKGNVCR